jgi:hypothetical protein
MFRRPVFAAPAGEMAEFAATAFVQVLPKGRPVRTANCHPSMPELIEMPTIPTSPTCGMFATAGHCHRPASSNQN